MYCRLNQEIINGCRTTCNQGITFTVSFCEHSHTFVKIDEFVMGHLGRNGYTSCLPHPCTIENSVRHSVGINIGLLDHCLGRALLEPLLQVPQPTPADPYFHVY